MEALTVLEQYNRWQPLMFRIVTDDVSTVTQNELIEIFVFCSLTLWQLRQLRQRLKHLWDLMVSIDT